MSKFQVGDFVEAFGVRGVVTHVDGSHRWYPIKVTYNGINEVGSFTSDGRQVSWHKEPSLKLIERSKKKVKKWITLYVDGFGKYFGIPHASASAAHSYYVHVTPTDTASFVTIVEVEVEED